MTETVESGGAIIAGYRWSVRLELDADAFPEGVVITGHVRRRIEDEMVLATISTANGGVVRVNSRTIDLVIAGTISRNWSAGEVVLDLVRTDTDPDSYLGFRLTVPVMRPVTRGLA